MFFCYIILEVKCYKICFDIQIVTHPLFKLAKFCHGQARA